MRIAFFACAAALFATVHATAGVPQWLAPDERWSLDASVHMKNAWVSKPWSRNDPIYRNTREAIDHQMAGAKSPTGILAAVKSDALAHPNDALRQFRWAVAAYRAEVKSGRDRMAIWHPALDRLMNVLDGSLGTDEIEFARIRYLITERYSPHMALLGAAKKLVKAYPEDQEVLYLVSGSLAADGDLSDKLAGREIAEKGAANHPESLDWLRALAFARYQVWSRTYKAADGEKAVKAYEALGQRMPKGSDMQVFTTQILPGMRRELAKQQKKQVHDAAAPHH